MTAEPDDLITRIRALTPAAPARRQREAALQARLDALPTTALPRLDYDVRWSPSGGTWSWESLTVDDARRLIAEAADLVTVAASLSLHGDGHIRELAVEELDRAGSPRSIRWLLLRCGDWVPPVRDAARQALGPWLNPTFADDLVDALPLIDGARFGARRPAADLRPAVVAVVSDPASRPAVERGVGSTSPSVRRACVRLLAAAGPDVALLERVIATDDVAAIALVAAALPTTGPLNRPTGEILLRSPMARFRSEGLWRLTRDDGPDGEALVRAALADAAPSVREVAQRWLEQHGVDTAAEYRSMLAEHPLVALRGLGDRPDPRDADTARRFVDHGDGSVRAAALRLLAGLGDSTDRPLFAHRFMAGTATERRYALAGLRRVGAGGLVDDLWAEAQARALAAGDLRPAERVLFQALPLAGRWPRIDLALQAVASGDPDVRRMGFEALQRATVAWNRGYTTLPADLGPLRQRLDDARPAFALADQHPAQAQLLALLEAVLGSSTHRAP